MIIYNNEISTTPVALRLATSITNIYSVTWGLLSLSSSVETFTRPVVFTAAKQQYSSLRTSILTLSEKSVSDFSLGSHFVACCQTQFDAPWRHSCLFLTFCPWTSPETPWAASFWPGLALLASVHHDPLLCELRVHNYYEDFSHGVSIPRLSHSLDLRLLAQQEPRWLH